MTQPSSEVIIGPTPAYVFDLIEAWASGEPLDFHGHVVPEDVQRAVHAAIQGPPQMPRHLYEPSMVETTTPTALPEPLRVYGEPGPVRTQVRTRPPA